MIRLPATAMAAAVLVAGIFSFWQAVAGLQTETQEKEQQAPDPLWQLPYESAAKQALKAKRPMLLVSLNGNLDGYC